MERTWVTGSAHDDKPLDWLFDLRHNDDVSHMADVLAEVAGDDDPAVGRWQTALLVCECIAAMRGAGSDTHPDAVNWLQRVQPEIDDAMVEQALALIDRAAADSSLLAWWRQVHPDRTDGWIEGLRYLAVRVRDGAEAPPPQGG